MVRQFHHARLQRRLCTSKHVDRLGRDVAGQEQVCLLRRHAVHDRAPWHDGLLDTAGWKARAQVRPNGTMVAARKGASNKIGYLAAHSAIVLICLGGLFDGDLVVRCLGRLAYGVYGPEKPLLCTSWQTAPWVGYERGLDQLPEMCWLSEQVGQHNVTFRCNNIDALANAVADGLGLGILPCLVGGHHPGLRCLSGDQAVLSREIWLVLPRELRDVPRVRVVGDWLVERFRRDEARFSRAA